MGLKMSNESKRLTVITDPALAAQIECERVRLAAETGLPVVSTSAAAVSLLRRALAARDDGGAAA